MVAVTMKTPYATAMPYVTALPSDLDEYNGQRVASYGLYDDLYSTDPETIRSMIRMADGDEIRYLPLAQTIVDTLARFTGKSWRFNVLPDYGTPADQQVAREAFEKLFRRERMEAKFSAMKPELIRRGDAVWYVRADPEKPEGSRISISTVDPRSYFPITDENDPDKIVGAMLVEDILMEGDEEAATKVQRWLKWTSPDHPNFGDPEASIAHDIVLYEPGTFFTEEPAVVSTLQPLDTIDGIHQLPLYHIKNKEQTQNPFGRSDLVGLESLCGGVSQTASDEASALAFAGLGMYVTDSGRPVDDNGEDTDWILGPGRVVEVEEGKTFQRINGVSDVEASQKHIQMVEDRAFSSLGISDTAVGLSVDGMAGAFSGIALAIRMQPIMDAADQKDAAINSVLTQMFYDLKEWFQVYESINMGDVQIESWSSSSDRVPFDRQQAWSELMDGYEQGIFSLEYVHAQLNERFGYSFENGDPAESAQNERVFRNDVDDAREQWFARSGMIDATADTAMASRMAAERGATT